MRHRRDIDDEDDDLIGDMFDREAVAREKEERIAKRAAAEEANRKSQEFDAAMAAQRVVRQEHLAREGTRRGLIAGYEKHGVKPPKVDAEGNPTCSIELLFTLGWTIMRFEFEGPRLIEPAPVDMPVNRTEGT